MSDSFWEQFAQADPLWAILSDPSKRGRRWDIESFMETGRREVSLLLYQLRELGHDPQRQMAVDFGCGVGRLTQALGAHFDRVVGLDVSPTMIRLAKRLNRHGERAVYVENHTNDLSVLETGTVDFLYSDVVLQHIEPALATQYVGEFLRILRVGGVAVFQMASHPRPEVASVVRPSAMADDAYRVSFAVSDPPVTLTPGASATLAILVTNASGRMWPSSAGQIRIGNHWLHGATGAMLVQDDGRVALPAKLAPGIPLRVVLTINAPKTPGAYICEIDAVHEGITWFVDRGGEPVRIPMVVSGTFDAAEAVGRSTKSENKVDPLPDIYDELPPDATEPGEFPMFGVPHEIVRDIVEAQGGRIFLQESDERCGPEWIGFRFFVEKLGSEPANPGL